jgi:hypothetical protein
MTELKKLIIEKLSSKSSSKLNDEDLDLIEEMGDKKVIHNVVISLAKKLFSSKRSSSILEKYSDELKDYFGLDNPDNGFEFSITYELKNLLGEAVMLIQTDEENDASLYFYPVFQKMDDGFTLDGFIIESTVDSKKSGVISTAKDLDIALAGILN